MSINLSFVKTKNTLSVAAHKKNLRDSIIAKIVEIDQHETLKFDNELLIFICNCIENALDIKMDKKALALDILHHVFELSQDDRLILGASIDFLCNNKLVKKMHTITKITRMTSDWFVRHLWNRLVDWIWSKFTAKSMIIQLATNHYNNYILYVLVTKIGLNYSIAVLILLLL